MSRKSKTGRRCSVPAYNLGKGKAYAWIVDRIDYQGDDCIKWPFSGFQGYGMLSHMKKRYRASRLMCTLAHGEPPTPEHEAAHSCGNGGNGCMNQKHLSWKTRIGNRADCEQHGTNVRNTTGNAGKLTLAQVEEIRALEGKETGTALAARYGVADDTIYSIWKGRTWQQRKSMPNPLTPEQVLTIRSIGYSLSANAIAQKLGVTESAVQRARLGHSYKHVTSDDLGRMQATGGSNG